MASPEIVGAFDEQKRLHKRVLTIGVRATERWLQTPPEQRQGSPEEDAEFVKASRDYALSRGTLDTMVLNKDIPDASPDQDSASAYSPEGLWEEWASDRASDGNWDIPAEV
jgi:hypothetical protein